MSINHFETVRITRDGRKIDVSLTVSPIKNSAGKTIGASKIVRDITARKRDEEAFNARRSSTAEIELGTGKKRRTLSTCGQLHPSTRVDG